MPGVTEHLVIAYPFAFEFPGNACVPRRTLHLWRAGLLQRRQCAVSSLLKVTGQLTVSIKLQFQLNAERAFYRETNVRRFHRDIRERHSFHIESGNDY